MVSDEMCNHSAWWAAVLAEARVRSTGRARGDLQGENCSVPPSAGMNPSGRLQRPITARRRGGPATSAFCSSVSGSVFWSHRCKVRKTFNSTKIRQFLPVACVCFLPPPSLALPGCSLRRRDLGACVCRAPQWRLLTLGEFMDSTMIQWVGKKKKCMLVY